MRVIVIGAVAGGTSAAAKIRRNDEEAEIIIYDKDSFISYSGCGMPYYIGEEVKEFSLLTPRNADSFKQKYNIDVLIQHEVLKIDSENKKVVVKNMKTNMTFDDHYDKLVIATGAVPLVPPIKGISDPRVFMLRNIGNMQAIVEFIHKSKPKNAVVVGTGFVGLEVCENLTKLGIKVAMVEHLPHVTPGLDEDMAHYVEDELIKNGIRVFTNSTVTKIDNEYVELETGEKIPADFILLSTGVRPNTELAQNADIELGVKNAIKVNKKMETNIKDIYACGDCIEQYSLITKEPLYRPLGSTANKTGRIAGENVTGVFAEFRGILGTGIFKIFDLTVAMTGLSEREVKENGIEPVVIHNTKPNKPVYMGGKEMIIKAVADSVSGRVLGVQIVGYEGVDKRIDVFVTAITFKANAQDLFHLDLAYSPPFSTTKDPVMYTGMILENAINKGRRMLKQEELNSLMGSGEQYQLIDTREKEQFEAGHVETAINIPHSELRERLKSLDPGVTTVTYCNKGVTGNAAQNILLNNGFSRVFNLSGGHKHYCNCNKKK